MNPIHRGHLYLIDHASPGALDTQELTEIVINFGDPEGFGVGVWGIKIDNIDGQGRPEIWVTDARGYLYALWYNTTTSAWECFYGSKGLGMYAGMYNKIWAHKVAGKTEWLAVQTPGYLYRFDVDPGEVPTAGE